MKGRGRSPHLGTGPFHTLLSRLLGGTRMEHSGNTNGKVPKLVPKGPDGPAGDAEPVILASPRQGPAASPGKARLESGNGRSSWGLSGRPGPQSQAGRGVSEKPPLQTPGGPRARSPQHLTSGVSPLPRRQSKIQNPQFWQISGPSRTRKAAEISGQCHGVRTEKKPFGTSAARILPGLARRWGDPGPGLGGPGTGGRPWGPLICVLVSALKCSGENKK